MTPQQLSRLIEIIDEARAILVGNSDVVLIPPVQDAGYPKREVPPAHGACKRMWEAAMNATNPKGQLFNIFAFVGQGLTTGQLPDQPPRMSQDTQDRLEAAIRALGRSDWGQEWLSHDENAALIDHRYCFYFVGYYVTRNPDDTLTRHYTSPGDLPV